MAVPSKRIAVFGAGYVGLVTGACFAELGHEASVVGVARLYAPVAAALVIDPVDAELAADVEAVGVRAVVVPSVMSTPDVAAELARSTLAAVTELG